MWLPKDERRLLRYYYRQINKVETSQNFEIKDLIKEFRKDRVRPSNLNREKILVTYNMLENVNNLLSRRGLIKWENLNPESITAALLYDHPTSQELFENTKVNFRITLTIEGYDLGRKYSFWWSSSKLWYEEHIKNHPIWLIVSYMAGIDVTPEKCAIAD
jgi:hypothetical protein